MPAAAVVLSRYQEPPSLPADIADKHCLLAADIGGTHARFALADRDGPGYSAAMTLGTADYDGIEAAIAAYLERSGFARPAAICVAAAGPLEDGRIRLTNGDWVIAEADLARDFGTGRVRLLNDFEAVAWAMPCLAASDVVAVGGPAPRLPASGDFTIGIVGPGTGFGAAGLLRRDGRLVPVPGEAGHTGFAPETAEQFEVFAALGEEFDRVVVEHFLSGPGILNICRALGRLRGAPPPADTASGVFAACDDGNALAADAVRFFFDVLGQVAGDLALLLGARDGVYIAGGIVPRYPALLAGSGFRRAFERKDNYRGFMQRIPTALVTHPAPGLLGASAVARELAGIAAPAAML